MKNLLFILLFTAISSLSHAQQARWVEGTVSDQNGMPLIGATVWVSGTDIVTVVPPNGQYRISVPSAGSCLCVSYVGFVTQSVYIANRPNINITLVEDYLMMMMPAVILNKEIAEYEKSLAQIVNTNENLAGQVYTYDKATKSFTVVETENKTASDFTDKSRVD